MSRLDFGEKPQVAHLRMVIGPFESGSFASSRDTTKAAKPETKPTCRRLLPGAARRQNFWWEEKHTSLRSQPATR